ncbi:MAG: hypothetical protein ABFR97_09945 [Thermodesulfobacteriota bacterium]
MFEIFGTTYYYNGGPLIVLLVVSPVAALLFWLLARFVNRSMSNSAVLVKLFGRSWRATVVFLAALTVIMHLDIIWVAHQVKHLCKEQGGLHIYKTAQVDGFCTRVGDEEWLQMGFSYVEHDRGYVKYRTDSQNKLKKVDQVECQYELTSKDEILSYHLKRSSFQVRDRITKDVLGERVSFVIYPSFVDRFLLGVTGFHFSPWRCGDTNTDKGQTTRISAIDIVKNTLFPTNNKE